MIPMAPGFFRPQLEAISSDECFDEVILLLHGEGTNGSTTITGSSASNKTATVNGNTQIKTDNYKYGTAAIYFDGTGDYLSYADSNDWDFGAIDYTWEFWARPDETTAGASRRIFGQGNSLGGEIPVDVSLTTGGYWQASIWNGVSASSNYTIVGGSSFPEAQCSAGRWDHVALVCEYVATPIPVNVFSLYVNGVFIESKQPLAADAQQVGTSMSIGRVGGFDGQYFKGYLDEVRFTQGCARYTDEFDPPVAQFPDQ